MATVTAYQPFNMLTWEIFWTNSDNVLDSITQITSYTASTDETQLWTGPGGLNALELDGNGRFNGGGISGTSYLVEGDTYWSITDITNNAATGPYPAFNAGTYLQDDDEDSLFADILLLSDTLTGSAGNDLLMGYGGADLLQGGDGNDTLMGGTGDNDIQGGAGYDFVSYAQDGPITLSVDLGTGQALHSVFTDSLSGFEGVEGGSGPDTLAGSDSTSVAETFIGGEGDDEIDGAGGKDFASYQTTPYGQPGVDVTLDSGSATVTHDWAGIDSLANIEGITGTHFDDTLTGGAGDQTFRGMGGADQISGGADTDTADYSLDPRSVIVNLGARTVEVGDETLAPGTARDGWSGVLEGHDTVDVENVIGSAHNDLIIGSSAANMLEGGTGADTLKGGGGNDNLKGLGGNDQIEGGGGADQVRGAAGSDTLTGGAAADKFYFDTALNASTNKDTILDFSHSQADKIVLDNDIFAKFNTSETTRALTSANFDVVGTSDGGHLQDSNDWIVYNKTTGVLSYDADGSGAGAAIAFAVVGTATHPTLVAGDFTIIA